MIHSLIFFGQNSLVGDGFGGRLWYKPYNYTIGSYSAYTICNNNCNNNTNQLYSWGANQYGQLGDGTTAGTTAPVLATGMTNVRFYTTGYCMAAIKNDNTGWVWGRPAFSALPMSYTPIQVLTDARFTDAGEYACSFVKTDGTVWTVGANLFGAFGNGSINPVTSIIPSQMSGINAAVRVANGELTTTVLLTNGTVMSVGDNRYGGLGNGSASTTVTTTAAPVPGLTNIVDLKANKQTNIALTANGDVYAWGYNGWLGLGTGGPGDGSDNAFTPQKITGLNNIVAISGCDDGIHFLALDVNHNCYAWGFAAYGQLGSNALVRVSPPVMVMTNVDDIMAGETFSYLVKTDGTLWASGASLYTFNFTPGGIWMNLPETQRNVFTQIDPTIAPMNLCLPIKRFLAFANSSGCGSVTVTESGGTAPYSYDIGTGSQAGNTFNGLAAGTYTVTVTDANGCVTSTDVKVVGGGIAAVNVSATNATCSLLNGIVNIGTVTGGVSPYTYSFNNQAFSSVTNYTNLATGTYPVVVKDVTSCTFPTSVNVGNTAGPTAVATIISGSSCTVNDGSVIIGNVTGGTAPYQYNFNNAGFSSVTTYLNLAPGTYPIIVKDVNGCLFNANAVVATTSPLPTTANAGADQIINTTSATLAGNLPLTGTGIWTVVSGRGIITNPSSPTASVTNMEPGNNIFQWTISNSCGSSFDQVNFTVKSPVGDFYLPNAFTPNGDSKNDVFRISSYNNSKISYFRIYNIYGELVYNNNSLSAGWDGTYKGGKQPMGTYVWMVQGITNSGYVMQEKGTVLLIR